LPLSKLLKQIINKCNNIILILAQHLEVINRNNNNLKAILSAKRSIFYFYVLKVWMTTKVFNKKRRRDTFETVQTFETNNIHHVPN
jgi:hypothetical protein